MEWIWKEKPESSMQDASSFRRPISISTNNWIEVLRFRGKVWAEDINLEVTAQTWYVKA